MPSSKPSPSKPLSSDEPSLWRPADLGTSALARGKPWIGDLGTAATPNPLRSISDLTPQQAYELGLRRGIVEAKRLQQGDSRKQLNDALETQTREAEGRLQALLAAFRTQLNGQEENIASQLVELATKLAATTVRTHLESTEEAVLPIVKEALTCILPGTRSIVLSVSEQDEELVRRALASSLDDSKVTLVADRTMTRSDCRIDSEQTCVDQTLETRWAEALRQTGITQNGPLAERQ